MTASILPFYLTVQNIQRISESFMRVTLAGEDLAQFGVDGPTQDLRIKIVLPGSGPLPDYRELMTGDDWFLRWREMDPETRGDFRTYTVRELRGGSNPELDIDFVLHLGDSSGPASRWADQAKPGDSLLILGPNKDSDQGRLAIEWSAIGSDRLLVVADETGVPAVASTLETLPADATGDVLLEVPLDDDVMDLRGPEGVQVRWFARNGATRGEQLISTVQTIVRPAPTQGAELEDVDIDTELLWETASEDHQGFYAFIAGEASVVKTIRRYLVRDCGIDRKSVSFMGYWREGRSEGS